MESIREKLDDLINFWSKNILPVTILGTILSFIVVQGGNIFGVILGIVFLGSAVGYSIYSRIRSFRWIKIKGKMQRYSWSKTEVSSRTYQDTSGDDTRQVTDKIVRYSTPRILEYDQGGKKNTVNLGTLTIEHNSKDSKFDGSTPTNTITIRKNFSTGDWVYDYGLIGLGLLAIASYLMYFFLSLLLVSI